MVFPGGNSLITQYLYQNLKAALGASQLRTKNAVLKVIPGEGFVDVVVEEGLYNLKTIRAKSVVMANPKFVGKQMIAGLPPQQLAAMDKIEYWSYIVGNVSLKKKYPA